MVIDTSAVVAILFDEEDAERFGAAIEAGRLRPVIDRVLPLGEAAEAHRIMKASEHFGKIALRVNAA